MHAARVELVPWYICSNLIACHLAGGSMHSYNSQSAVRAQSSRRAMPGLWKLLHDKLDGGDWVSESVGFKHGRETALFIASSPVNKNGGLGI